MSRYKREVEELRQKNPLRGKDVKNILFATLLLFAFQSQASLGIYGVGNIGFMVREKEEKFVNFEKYGGGIGLQFQLLSFLYLGAELEYTRGINTDPKPSRLDGKVLPSSYGGFNKRGINFVDVHYLELWLRPGLMIPIPFVQPYLVLPISPMSLLGMRGYSSYGFGVGALLGIQIPISSFVIFAESGAVVRMRRGDFLAEKPPWNMIDFNFPVRLGFGYTF